MDWNDATQHRFDALRQRELTGPLSAEEQHELDISAGSIRQPGCG